MHHWWNTQYAFYIGWGYGSALGLLGLNLAYVYWQKRHIKQRLQRFAALNERESF